VTEQTRTRFSDLFLDRNLLVAAWVVAILAFGTSLVRIINGEQGYDTAPLTTAVYDLFGGGVIYTGKGAGDFLYPPSALLLLSPLGALSITWAGRLFFLVDVATVLVATAVLLHLFGLRWRGFAGAIAVFVLALAWPVTFTLDAGNVNGPVLLGLAGFLLFADRQRWILAGVCLGLTLALKPILAPVLLVVALYRRWQTLVTAVAVPVVLSVPLLLAVPETRAYFHTSLPLLFHGQSAQIQEASIALQSAAARVAVPDAATHVVEIAVLVLTLWLLWQRSRGSKLEPRRLVELTTIALVGGFLLSSFAFAHYGIFVLPFAVSLVDRSSPHRHWLTAACLFCIGARQGWALDRLPHRVNEILSERFTLSLLGLLFAFWLGMRRESLQQSAPRTTGDAGPEAVLSALKDPVSSTSLAESRQGRTLRR
jgi:arabinofuranan 3-O-arabinosyltransferase